jgi:ABC-type branched-subunit amino acid transport system permease subunit
MILKIFNSNWIKIALGVVGFVVFCSFGFLFAAAYAASRQQCPYGNDCDDAWQAAIAAGFFAIAGLTLAYPLFKTIWRKIRKD